MSLRVAGVFAEYFSQFHYDSWAGMRQVDLRASCDCDIDQARAPGLPAYDDLDAMMAEQDWTCRRSSCPTLPMPPPSALPLRLGSNGSSSRSRFAPI